MQKATNQAQVKALGEPPWWLVVLGNFGRINKRRARRGAEHCRLLLRAFNEVSMFHFRDKRALCHTGGPRWERLETASCAVRCAQRGNIV